MGKINGLEKHCTSDDGISKKISIRDKISKWKR